MSNVTDLQAIYDGCVSAYQRAAGKDLVPLLVYADACEELGRTFEAGWIRKRKFFPTPPVRRGAEMERVGADPDVADPIATLSAMAQKKADLDPLVLDAVARIGKARIYAYQVSGSEWAPDIALPCGAGIERRYNFREWGARGPGGLLVVLRHFPGLIDEYEVVFSRGIDIGIGSAIANRHFGFNDVPAALRFGPIAIEVNSGGASTWLACGPKGELNARRNVYAV